MTQQTSPSAPRRVTTTQAARTTRSPDVEQDVVEVPWGDARKHRGRVTTRAGRQVVLDLPRGSFLAHDDVLWSDDALEVRVERPLEPAVVVDFADNRDHDAVRRALLLGYTLGNQHAPLDLDADQLRVPLMTGVETAERVLRDLRLVGRVRDVRLAARGWATTSADHREGHRHDAPDHEQEQVHEQVHEHGHEHGPVRA